MQHPTNNELNLFSESADESGDGALFSTTVRGYIHRVVYENATSGYAVLRVHSSNYGECTFVGPLTGAHEGEEIEADGRWERHKEHGKQFKVDSFRFTLPTTRQGICKYLASGVLKGIGEKKAKQIVDFFGDNTLNVLSATPSKLREIPGFGSKIVSQIQKSWANEKDKREIFIFMHGLGIGTATCQKLYIKYGAGIADLIKENPYKLADEVHGIGFLSADRIAQNLGIEKNSEIRIRAGIIFAFKQLFAEGHTCYPYEKFLPYTAELLDLDVERVGSVIQTMTDERKLIKEKLPLMEEDAIYEAQMFKIESEFACRVQMITNAKNHYGRRLNTIPPISKMEFSEEQLSAVETVSSSPLTIITGGPGVGKTTVIGEIVARARACKMKVYLAAPTGRAAKRMSESTHMACSTIHRLLKWQPESGTFEYGTDKKLPCHILIVDEISMLDLPLGTYLFRAIHPGTTVVLVGDADQLPSVGPGRVLHDLIQSHVCPVTQLKRIYRQKDASLIITNAHRVNEGYLPEQPSAGKNTDFYWIEQEDPEKAVQQIVTMAVHRIPAKFGFDPMSDIQILTPMNRGECGVTNLNIALQGVLNGGDKPTVHIGDRLLKLGDRVMQTVNNYELNVYNGDMGRIKSIVRDKEVVVDFDGRAVPYAPSDLGQLVLSYAVTVHKSQGSEFPCVIMPIMKQHFIMLQRNLLYTGITRAKKLLILIGPKKAMSMAVHNFKQAPRYTTLSERIQAQIEKL